MFQTKQTDLKMFALSPEEASELYTGFTNRGTGEVIGKEWTE